MFRRGWGATRRHTCASSGLVQRLSTPALTDLRAQAAMLARNRPVARAVLPWLARSTAARGIYRSYPRQASETALRSWSRTARLLLDRTASP